jgi:hypothetical protein
VKFTDSQEQAIKFGAGNLQLIACAGSGKTEVVARRVVHLLTPGRPDSLVPANIIAFTFTDKAAAELKERIHTRTREALGEVPGMAEMFVGTIHAFCLEVWTAPGWQVKTSRRSIGRCGHVFPSIRDDSKQLFDTLAPHRGSRLGGSRSGGGDRGAKPTRSGPGRRGPQGRRDSDLKTSKHVASKKQQERD